MTRSAPLTVGFGLDNRSIRLAYKTGLSGYWQIAFPYISHSKLIQQHLLRPDHCKYIINMDNDANLHGAETPTALASSATVNERTIYNEGMNALRMSISTG